MKYALLKSASLDIILEDIRFHREPLAHDLCQAAFFLFPCAVWLYGTEEKLNLHVLVQRLIPLFIWYIKYFEIGKNSIFGKLLV